MPNLLPPHLLFDCWWDILFKLNKDLLNFAKAGKVSSYRDETSPAQGADMLPYLNYHLALSLFGF